MATKIWLWSLTRAARCLAKAAVVFGKVAEVGVSAAAGRVRKRVLARARTRKSTVEA